MPRFEVLPDHRLLVRLLRSPEQLAALSPQEFSRAIDASEDARLLGWLITQIDRQPFEIPGWLSDRLVTARALVRNYERAVRWEIDRISRAFSDRGLPLILLKGGGYVAAALPTGYGRRVADVDVLVPEARLADAEKALLEHGWAFAELDAYDERYYRQWMHELPPMVHKDRGSVIDLHHAILPRTSRRNPSSARLIEQSVEVAAGVRVLSKTHMVVHAAAHLFHDGEIAGAIRDLVDVDALLRCFGQIAGFWDDLLAEARLLDLTRSTYYALRYAERMLSTPIPKEVGQALSAWAPPSPVGALMDALVERTIPGASGPASSWAAFLLYVRSHWLRMPPLLLARHLLRKSMRS
jgi:hypothetical protein